ncbi:MAG: PepSY domain-containing protein, partial [Comamonas sp.]
MRFAIKRWLFLLHRWLGIGLCVLLAAWFFSGAVMLYVGYPKLTESERLQHLPALPAQAKLLGPQQALQRAGLRGPLADLRLSLASQGQPSYLVTLQGERKTTAVDASTGAVLQMVGAEQALASAQTFTGAPLAALHYQGTVQEDAFTHSRGLDAHRPLHVVAVDGEPGLRLYLSGRTAEVVRDATRRERGWNYVGAWLHWLYMFRGNAANPYWGDVVNTLSVIGLVLAISGTVVGIMRWRFAKPYRSGRRTPYPSRSMRWHHISGLLFAAVTITWLFSGLMSMNPLRIFDSKQTLIDVRQWPGTSLQWVADSHAATPAQLLAAAGVPVVELRWQPVLGRLQVLATQSNGQHAVLDAQNAQRLQYQPADLITAAQKLSTSPIARQELLNSYDFYYYGRDSHSMMGSAQPPLPVLRVQWDDPARTW